MTERMFPVLWQDRDLDAWGTIGCPRAIPWRLLAPFEAQAKKNHDQSLERLASRGGLSPAEIMCVVEGRKLSFPMRKDIEEIPRLVEWLAAQNVSRCTYPCDSCPYVCDESGEHRRHKCGRADCSRPLDAEVVSQLIEAARPFARCRQPWGGVSWHVVEKAPDGRELTCADRNMKPCDGCVLRAAVERLS